VSERNRRARPLATEELGFERIVYEKAPPGRRSAQTPGDPETVDTRCPRDRTRVLRTRPYYDSIRVVVVAGGRALRRRET